MKPEILLVCQMNPHVMESLERDYSVHHYWQSDDQSGFLAQVGPGVRGIATSGHHGASAAMMEACPKLEIISSYGVGYDAVDVPQAQAREVIVTNTPDVLNDDVSNLAIALLLDVTRRVSGGDRYVREGRWLKEGDMPLARAIHGRTLGILGLGRIGKLIAQKAEVFGCEVAYHGRQQQDDQPYRYFASLVELAEASDFLVVICPGGAATEKLVDRAVLDALGPDGILINVARGSVVDEPALVAALEEGRLGGAGLDVFVAEPKVPEALLAMEQVVLQPHRGSATVETRHAMGQLMLDNLKAHFAGRPVLTPVT